MSKTGKVTLVVLILLIAFITAVVVVAPRLFQVDRYRPQLISLLENETGMPVAIGHLSLSVLPVISIQVDHFAFGNPPGFPRGYWLSVQRITARLDSKALWNRQVVVKALDLDNPSVGLLCNSQGKWNFQSRSASKASDPPPPDPLGRGQPLFQVREISELKIEQGTLTMATLEPGGQPEPSSVQASGIAGHLDHIVLQELLAPAGSRGSSENPASSGALGFLSTGAAGELSADEVSFGKLSVTKVQSTIQTTPSQLLLNPVAFKLYSGQGEAKITVQLSGPSASYQTQASFSGVDAEKLLNQFPGLQGSLTGTLQGRLTLLSGESSASADPWVGKRGEGVVVIRNGRLPKLKMNTTLVQLARVAQLGPSSGDISSFSSITATWRLANEILTTPSIQIAGRGLTGSAAGTVDLRGGGRLNYQGIGHIPAQANALTNVLAGISGSTLHGNDLSISFAVQGTLARPAFQLKPNYQRSQPQPGSKPNQNQAPQVLQNLFKLFQPHKP